MNKCVVDGLTELGEEALHDWFCVRLDCAWLSSPAEIEREIE